MKVDYILVPIIRHQVREQNPDALPVKHAGTDAGVQAPSELFLHIDLGPALLQEEFNVPQDIVKETQVLSKRPAPEEEEQSASFKRPRRSTRSSSKSGVPSLPVSIALPPQSQPVPSTAVVPGKPAKKYVSSQCGKTTDRKHDFDK